MRGQVLCPPNLRSRLSRVMALADVVRGRDAAGDAALRVAPRGISRSSIANARTWMRCASTELQYDAGHCLVSLSLLSGPTQQPMRS